MIIIQLPRQASVIFTWRNNCRRCFLSNIHKINSLYSLKILKSNFHNIMANDREKKLCLFDVDGTITAPMQIITTQMEHFIINEIKPRTKIGLVGGSDLMKILKQIGGDNALHKYDYVFAENGLIAYKNGHQLRSENIQSYMGEEKLQLFINFSLNYMSKLILPFKRGTFIEFRTGLINVSPVGRSCNQNEREQFYSYDKEHHIREKFIDALKKEFPDIGLHYSIGGQISFDVFPEGWDKTYCLKHIENENFEEIHFFGDKTGLGGNDHEIYNDSRTIGHSVLSPHDTMKQLNDLFLKN